MNDPYHFYNLSFSLYQRCTAFCEEGFDGDFLPILSLSIKSSCGSLHLSLPPLPWAI